MHFPGTPSPFRLSRRNPPTRRSAGPQFANSPRFLLSQTTPRKDSHDLDIVDDDSPPSTTPAVRTPAPSRKANPRRQREVIEDSDDGEYTRNTGREKAEVDALIDDDDYCTLPTDPNTPGPLDAQYDALFAPVRESNKRRRLSAGQPSTEWKGCDEPNPESIDPGLFESPSSRPPQIALPGNIDGQITPRMPVRPTGPTISTPGSTKTPFRSKPKFMLKLPSTQPIFRDDGPSASQPLSPPTERRKLAFVLPRSPSPSAATEDIPAPFSPSSRTLHRRGRPRSGVQGYVPGGMADEVRSWILEVGSKRDQMASRQGYVNSSAARPESLAQYLVAARVINASSESHSSSGLLTFIRAERVTESIGDEGKEAVNILAMGRPRSKTHIVSTAQGMTLQVGDLVGVHRGLAWDVELPPSQDLDVAATTEQQRSTPGKRDNVELKERWLVTMEWDLIQKAT